MKRLIIACLFLLTVLKLQATALSPQTKVYLVTMGPGEELYSGFGHSAIWFKDSTINLDRVYNYGTFDFNSEFYVKFLRGILDYMLSVHEFHYLLDDATSEQRYLKLQELNLSAPQQEKLFAFLEHNYLPENKYYRYDFFYDNCSSRIRDVFQNVLGDSLKYDLSENKNLTFRQLIDLYLHDKRLQDFGMDIGLGAPADVKATPAQYMFLPEFLKNGFDKAKILTAQGWQPLVSKETSSFKPTIIRNPEPTNYTAWACWALCISVVVFTYLTMTKPFAGRGFDAVWFAITGLVGCLLLFLWFGTDHNTTQLNCDLLWAVPTNLIVSVLLWKRSNSKVLIGYLIFLLACCLLLLFGWKYMPEEMNSSVFPLVVLSLWRLMKLLYDRMSIFPKE